MQITGHLRKMKTSLAEPVRYVLSLDGQEVEMNELLGHSIQLRFTGQIHCRICGRKTSKSFGEGYCYPDFLNHPENSPCIVRPELCEAHLGQGRDPEWEQQHHNQPHVVYLAKSSAVKVGVTRVEQIPTRWIDQGASEAILLAELPYRQLAGQLEVYLKDQLPDKTNWQQMLKGLVSTDNLLAMKDQVASVLPEEFHEFISFNDDITRIHYPVSSYPAKVKALNLDKEASFGGKLTGIKGQYWLFEDGQVFNVRKHTSYEVELSA